MKAKKIIQEKLGAGSIKEIFLKLDGFAKPLPKDLKIKKEKFASITGVVLTILMYLLLAALLYWLGTHL